MISTDSSQSDSHNEWIEQRGLVKIVRVDPQATSFAHRDMRYLLSIIGIRLDPTDDSEVHRSWTESHWQVVRHEGSSVYVNVLDDEGAEHIRDALPKAANAQLAVITLKYDPDYLFRFNENIKTR